MAKEAIGKADYFSASTTFLFTGFLIPVALAGLDFPKEPLKIFPFFVFLSPLPIHVIFRVQN